MSRPVFKHGVVVAVDPGDMSARAGRVERPIEAGTARRGEGWGGRRRERTHAGRARAAGSVTRAQRETIASEVLVDAT